MMRKKLTKKNDNSIATHIIILILFVHNEICHATKELVYITKNDAEEGRYQTMEEFCAEMEEENDIRKM